MALPKGPFKRIEFIPPEKLAQGQRGKIIIHAEPAIEIEPESLYYYLLIQIVAESQKKYAKEFAKGVSPDVVLHYLKQINETLVVPRKIKKPGSLKHAWRKHIRKGTQFTFYSYNKSGKKELELELLDKASFMNNQFTPAEKVSGELPFKINIINPRRLIFRHKLLSTLKPHREAGETEPESVSIIEKYIQSLSTDFKIRNISFFGDYKDMLSDDVYIPREFERQGHTSPDLLDMYTPGPPASDFYRLLVKNSRIIIEGEPGSGKTILLRNIALTLATNFERDRLVPLYVELRGYGRVPNQRLDDYAVEIAGTNARFTQEEKLDFAKSIRENEANLVFLLDGYDEAGNNPEIVKQQILSLPSASKTVITSRKYSSTIGLTPVLRLELKPFDRPSQRLFVENAARVFGIQESGKDRLVMHIWGSSSFSDMAQNPFFLLCICFVGRAGNDTPSRRIELLRQVQVRLLDHFLNKISTNSQDVYRVIKYLRNITRNGATIFDSIYSRLAFHHFSRHELEFSEASIVNLVEAVAREYNVSQYRFELCNAVLNCGLLVTGSFQNSYSFVHPLFMEYYAAQELIRTPEWKEIVLNNYLNPSWRNVILFFIAQCGISRFQEIYELLTHHDDYFHNGLLLAAESISELEEYPPQTEEIINKLCKIVDKHPLNYILIDSLFTTKTALPYLWENRLRFLTDPHINRLMVESLVKRGAAPYLDKCVDLISKPLAWNPEFAQLVSHYGKQIKPEILADTLLGYDNEHLRTQCALALGLIASDLAETKLIQALLRDKDNLKPRDAAITALKNIRSTRSVEAFMQVLTNDQDNSSVRAKCAQALGRWKAYQAVSTLVAILSKPTEDTKVRTACAHALSEIGAPEAIAPLMQALIHETNLDLRSACVYALGSWRSERALDKLAEILGNAKEDLGLRITYARVLWHIRNEKAVNKLIEVLADPSEDQELRRECAWALATIGNEKASRKK